MNIVWTSWSDNKFRGYILFWLYKVSWFFNSRGSYSSLKQLCKTTFICYIWEYFQYHKCSYLFLSVAFTLFSGNFCCKKVWWYIFDYTLSNKILCLLRNLSGKKSIYFWQSKFKIFVWFSVYVFAGYNQSLWQKSNIILFFIFKYVTYINSLPLNP